MNETLAEHWNYFAEYHLNIKICWQRGCWRTVKHTDRHATGDRCYWTTYRLCNKHYHEWKAEGLIE